MRRPPPESVPTPEAAVFVDAVQNGKAVTAIRPGYSPWTCYEFQVTAKGSDVLAFHGGKAPAWSFPDDIYVFAF